MNKVRKVLMIMVLTMTMLFSYQVVFAEEEYYYTNPNGVSFTREAYDFFSEFFYEGYQAHMTQAMFDEYVNEGFDFANTEITKVGLCMNPNPVTIGNQASPQDLTYYATYGKSIEMGQACGILCRVSAVVTWHGVPACQSHDVMGAYLNGPTRISTPSTMYTSSAGSGFEDAIVYDTNGYGAVISVPNAGDIVVSQSIAYTGHGLIFMSYQHAVSTVSLSNAQNFTIGLAGYGNVFIFPSSIGDQYDQMNGVYMTV